jgi:hypothetical protein
MPPPSEKSSTEESNLPAEQKAILGRIRELGLKVNAETFAYLAFGRDIDELQAEELKTIPDFLRDPWLEEQEHE